MKSHRKNSADVLNRRDFIKTTSLATGAVVFGVPTLLRAANLNSKLNIAASGAAGKGADDTDCCDSENIVALCDVDSSRCAKQLEKYAGAKFYQDYRKMLDEMGKGIDAVTISTPDHFHAVAASAAMRLGKAVYCQKPLVQTIYEARYLRNLARETGVVTQMGNQGSAQDGLRRAVECIQAGIIGHVRQVHVWTNRPIWPQGMSRPEGADPVPASLDWNTWIGPAAMRPYKTGVYHPWNWRGWLDFGTGALGDMACHIMHPVFKSLKLQYPIKAQGSSTLLLTDCAPNAQMVTLTYPERVAPKGAKIKYPEVQVTWYDGGLEPPKPAGWPAGKDMNDSGGGVIFHGSKDTLICGCYGVRPWLLSGRKPVVPKTERRIEKAMDGGHEMDWVRACKENADTRVKTKSDFSEAGPFNEMVVMGVLAVRLQGLNKELEWNGEKMEFTNIGDTDNVKICISDNFTITNGDPKFDRKWTEPIPAKQFASEMIKHTYRKGFILPDMPA